MAIAKYLRIGNLTSHTYFKGYFLLEEPVSRRRCKKVRALDGAAQISMKVGTNPSFIIILYMLFIYFYVLLLYVTIYVGPLYSIVFDDRSAPTTLTTAVFRLARAAYLALPVEEQAAGGNFEPPPRQPAAQRQQQNSDGGRQQQQQQQQSSTTAISATVRNRMTPSATQQSSEEQQLPVPRSAAAVVNRRTNTAVGSSLQTPQIHQRLQQQPVVRNDPTPPLATSTTTSSSSNNNITANNVTTTLSSTTQDHSSDDILLCCAIQECVEFCSSTSQPCTECPARKRTYLYCYLHERHSSHSNQTCYRRNNIIEPNITSTNNDTTAASNSTDNSTLGFSSSRRKRTRISDDDELCMCGCKTTYHDNYMIHCKGNNCSNRLRHACVPNTWLCEVCKYKNKGV